MGSVAIVVLNWNGWRDTLRCVASLRSLQGVAAQILVVDNGSTDGSVSRLRQQLPDLVLLESGANLGFGGGCNIGIRYAQQAGAEFIWLINNDAEVAPDTLSALLGVAQADPRLGAVGSVIYEGDATDRVQVWGGGSVNLWLGTSRHRRAPGSIDFVSGASMLLRSRALHEVGLFDAQRFFMYWEDTDLGFRLRRAGWALGVATQSRVWHRESSSLGQGSVPWDRHSVQSGVRFLRKHAPVPALSIALMLARLVIKRCALGRWDRVAAVWQAWRSA